MDWKSYGIGFATPLLLAALYVLANLFTEFFTTKIHRET